MTGGRLVFDLPVRLFHWVLVTAVIGSVATHFLGVAYFKYHLWCGCTVLVLIAFRVVWGFVGTRHARFASFIRGPAEMLRYTRRLIRGQAAEPAGHNPLGGVMVVLLLAGFAIQAITGLFSDDEIFNAGPLSGWIAHDLSLRLTSIHRRLIVFLAAPVLIHIFAAVAHSLYGRINLIAAMITGRKASDVVPEDQAIEDSRLWLALAIVLALSGILAAVLITAARSAI